MLLFHSFRFLTQTHACLPHELIFTLLCSGWRANTKGVTTQGLGNKFITKHLICTVGILKGNPGLMALILQLMDFCFKLLYTFTSLVLHLLQSLIRSECTFIIWIPLSCPQDLTNRITDSVMGSQYMHHFLCTSIFSVRKAEFTEPGGCAACAQWFLQLAHPFLEFLLDSNWCSWEHHKVPQLHDGKVNPQMKKPSFCSSPFPSFLHTQVKKFQLRPITRDVLDCVNSWQHHNNIWSQDITPHSLEFWSRLEMGHLLVFWADRTQIALIVGLPITPSNATQRVPSSVTSVFTLKIRALLDPTSSYTSSSDMTCSRSRIPRIVTNFSLRPTSSSS